jgi:hypothetical protein
MGRWGPVYAGTQQTRCRNPPFQARSALEASIPFVTVLRRIGALSWNFERLIAVPPEVKAMPCRVCRGHRRSLRREGRRWALAGVCVLKRRSLTLASLLNCLRWTGGGTMIAAENRLICTRCKSDVKSVLRCRRCGALCPTSRLGSAMLTPGAFAFYALIFGGCRDILVCVMRWPGVRHLPRKGNADE